MSWRCRRSLSASARPASAWFVSTPERDGAALDVLEPRAGHDEHGDAELADEGRHCACSSCGGDARPDDHEVGVRGLDARDGHVGRSDGGAHAQARQQALRAAGHDEHEARRRLDRDDAVRAVPARSPG